MNIVKNLLNQTTINVKKKNLENKIAEDLAKDNKIKECFRNYKLKKATSTPTNLKNKKKDKGKLLYEQKYDLKLDFKENLEEKINLDSFNINYLIGKGSFGEVYLVEKKNSKEKFAMKVLNKLCIKSY